MLELRVGDKVVVQEVWRGRLWSARPFIVVHHEPGLSALWMPAGTIFKGPSNPRTRPLKATPRERMLDNLRHVDWLHRDVPASISSLWIIPHGAWYCAQRGWLPNGDRLGWYVNFQEPVVQRPNALRTMDLALDLVVHPNGEQELKDRTEFDLLCAEGLLPETTSMAVLRDLEEVRRRLANDAFPFNERWASFEPDHPSATPLSLPDGWNVVLDDS